MDTQRFFVSKEGKNNFVSRKSYGNSVLGERINANTMPVQQFNHKIKEKWSRLAKKKVLFYQDNAAAHKSAIEMTEIHELRFESVFR